MNVENPRDAEMWIDAYRAKFEGVGKPFERPEWDQLLGHCMAVSDVPCISFWRELMDAYPDARVILTVRDNPDVWYRSFLETSMALLARPYGNNWLSYVRSKLVPESLPEKYTALLLKYDDHYSTCCQDYLDGTENGKECYERHNNAVLQHAREQGREVLVFNVKQGWTPLCEFLGVNPPDSPMPRLNESEYFRRNTRKIHALLLLGAVIHLAKYMVPVVAAAVIWRYVER